MCRVLGVSQSGFYAWNSRGPSARSIPDAQLTARIRHYHARSKGAYGAPNVHEDLGEEGVGWAMAEHLRTELVPAALNMALAQRRPREVVHHSDHGTQYTSIAFGLRCIEGWYNPNRRHSGIVRISPIEFERRHEVPAARTVTLKSQTLVENRF